MAGSNKNPFEVNDFSRGMTDKVHDQKPQTASKVNNFIIGSDKRPLSRPGSTVDNESFPEIPSGVRVGALVNYANSDKLFYQSVRNIFYRNPSAFSELLGPTGNYAFSSGDSSSVPSFAQWNRHLYYTNDVFAKPMKVYKDGSGNYQLRNAGLPALASAPTVTPGAGAFTYVYAFHYSYDYTVFDLAYQSIGPVSQVATTSANSPNVDPIAISAIPVITNGSTDNYDVANLKIKIFRSTADGTFLQQVGEVTNGTTSFVDTVSDITLQSTGEPLYINDGTVDFDPAPLHKFNHVVNNTGYYAHLKDNSGNVSPYKIRQSIPGVPDTGPIDFETDVDDELKGFSSVRSLPLAFCKRFVFRIDGAFDQFGRGSMNPVRISDHAGCVSHLSIVQAENGIFWFGNDGVYYSDGYEVNKVTDHLNDRYKDMLKNTAKPERIEGKYYEKERLIMWAVQTDSSSGDNDAFWICDLKWGISNEMTFYTWSGAYFQPSCIEIFNRDLYRGDRNGYVFKHSESLYSDPKINPYLPASQWTKSTIIWLLETIHYNFGGTFFRKYPTRILLTAGDVGNTTIQIVAINDAGKKVRNCKPIRNRRDFVWDDDDFVWRVSDFIWRGAGIIEQWRRFPAGGLRLSTLQLQITNGYSDITNSDTLGTATVGGNAQQVVTFVDNSANPLNDINDPQIPHTISTLEKIGVEYTTAQQESLVEVDVNIARTQTSNGGSVKVEVYTDNAGSPGTLVATSQTVPVSGLPAFAATLTPFMFSTPVTLISGQSYWFVLAGDATFVSNNSAVIYFHSGVSFTTKKFTGGVWVSRTNSLSFAAYIAGNQNVVQVSPTAKAITLDTNNLKWPIHCEDYYIATAHDGYVAQFLITQRYSDSVIIVNDPLGALVNGSVKWVIRGYKKDEPLHLLSFNVHWTNVSASQDTYHSSAASTGENA